MRLHLADAYVAVAVNGEQRTDTGKAVWITISAHTKNQRPLTGLGPRGARRLQRDGDCAPFPWRQINRRGWCHQPTFIDPAFDRDRKEPGLGAIIEQTQGVGHFCAGLHR